MRQRPALFSAIGLTFVLLAILGISLTAQAAPRNSAPARPQAILLNDNFDYGTTAGNLTTVSAGNWISHSGTSGFVGYTTTSLSMTGYGSSGVGGAATISTTGVEDVNRSFTNQTSGTVYFAALVNVSSAGTGGAYFLHLKDSGTVNFRARVFARNDGGILRFGLSDSSTGTYSTANFNYTTTYLLVAKYNVGTGNTALYVLDTFSATEPTTALITTTGTAQSVQGVALRQSSGGPTAIIDGVRVANTWAEVVGYVPPLEADLSVAKSGPATANAGDPITYTINLSNTGTTTATLSVLTDTLPVEVSFITYTTALTVNFSQPDAHTLVWDLGDVANGASGLITVQGVISSGLSAGTVVTNTVTASTTATETIIANNTSGAVTVVGAPDLVVVKNGPASVNAGDLVAYTLTYSNASNVDATGVVLIDQLPDAMSYVTDSLGTGVQTGNTITWTLGNLAANTSSSIVLTATAVIAGAQADMAVISGDLIDANPLNNSSVFTTTVSGVDPFVLKSGPPVLFSGDMVSYTITYGNHGNLPANVTITDTLPMSFTVIGDNSGLIPIDGANTRSWTTTIPANTTGISFTLALQVPLSITTSTRVTNTVEVATAAAGDNPIDNVAQAAATVHQFTSIHDIQYVVEADISDTSAYSGTYVAAQGVVVAGSNIFLGSTGLQIRYYIADPAGGAWSGIVVFTNNTQPAVSEGQWVRVYGQVNEFVQSGSRQTEIDLTAPGSFQQIVSSGNPLPLPTHIPTGDLINAGTAEQWESVLIEINNAVVTNPNPGFGEWVFDDGSGATRADDLAKSDGNTLLTYVPQLNDYYGYLRGIGWEAFGSYRLLPRYDADVNLDYRVTFVYHDLEDVVHAGEVMQLRGDFTNWDTNPITMAHDVNYTVFSATVTLPITGVYNYRYYVPAGGSSGYEWLNSSQRFIQISGPLSPGAQKVDHRIVFADEAQLLGPAAISVNLGQGTPVVSATLLITGVTDFDSNAGRGLQGQIGYGTQANVSTWTWSPLTFAEKSSGSDVYSGVFTPTASGVYSYAVRFNANWGTGNPNAPDWTYTDLDGLPFSLDKTGVLTVTAPQLDIVKTVATANAEVELGEVVTYTFTLSNTGDGTANTILITDVLPTAVTFGGFVQQNGATFSSGTVAWSGSLNAGASATVVFTATVANNPALYGTDVMNTVQFTSGNAGSGSANIAFAIVKHYFIYMPLIQR